MLKVGFIGGGFVGQIAHIGNYALNRNCELFALCEARPKLRTELQRHYGFTKTYASHSDMLADPEIQAVVAITRRQHTGPIALEVLQAGKPLLTEKPMCHTTEQGRLLVEEAQKRNLVFSVGYMRKYDQGVHYAKKWLGETRASGELGRLLYARVHCFGGESYCGAQAQVTTDEPYPSGLKEWATAPRWIPGSRAEEYASFLNVYCHNINLIRHLLGDPFSVEYAHLGEPAGGIAVLDSGDYRVTLELGKSEYRGWDDVIEVIFEKGRLQIELAPAFLINIPAKVAIYRGGSESSLNFPQVPWTWAFRLQADAFVSDVGEGRKPLASGSDALEDLQLIEEIWRKELARSPRSSSNAGN